MSIMSLEDPTKIIHIHELERSKSNKNIYRCTHPKCSYYQKREYLEGKECICFKCKQAFLLTWTQLRNKKPVCIYCSKSPKAKELKDLFDNLCNSTFEIHHTYDENSIINKQIKEADEINKQLSSSTASLSTSIISYTTHSQAVYTSRLLDFKNLPEPKNVEDDYSGN